MYTVYFLVCVGYVNNIRYDIIEHVLLIVFTTRMLASCTGLLNLTVASVIYLAGPGLPFLSDHPNKLVLMHRFLLSFSRDAALFTDCVESSCLFHLLLFHLCRIESARIVSICIMRILSM